jgi:hypothetical protein
MAAKYRVATAIGSGGSPTGIDATLGLGATLECFTATVTKSNELQEVKAETDSTKKSKWDDKICMMMTRLACNRAIESSYWRMDNDSDVGLLTGYVLYRLPVELEFMDLDTFPC